MKKIRIINLDDDSCKIKDSLQNFYGQKAEVTVVEITDTSLNVDVFFYNGMSVSFNRNHEKRLLIKLINANPGCRAIAFYGCDENGDPTYRQEDSHLYHERLKYRFGLKEDDGLYYDYKIWKGYLLSSIWYNKDLLLSFLIPKPKPHYDPPVTPMDEWVEY